MKILITGATGSLGASLCRHFSRKGHEVIAHGRMGEPAQELFDFADYWQADISSPVQLPNVDVVIHTAALADDKANYTDLYRANIIGTKNVVSAANEVPTFIHISSSSVYVPSNSLITEENSGPKNGFKLSAYGKSKLESEIILKKECSNDRLFILRPRVLYGVGDKVILPRMLKFVKGEKLVLPGKLTNKVSITNYKNIAHAIELCIKSNLNGIRTYNVTDDQSHSMIDIVSALTQSIYGKELNKRYIPFWVPALMSIFRVNGMTPLLLRAMTKPMVLDLAKIRTELDYHSVTDLKKEVKEIGKWVRKIGGIDQLIKASKALAWQVD